MPNSIAPIVHADQWRRRPSEHPGDQFLDIYLIHEDGGEELWASTVPRELADRFCADPWMYGHVHSDPPRLRTLALQWEDAGTNVAQVFYPLDGNPRQIRLTRAAIANHLNDYIEHYLEFEHNIAGDDQRLTPSFCQRFVDRWAQLRDEGDAFELIYDTLVDDLDFQVTEDGTIVGPPLFAQA